jgi:hypothetical protein
MGKLEFGFHFLGVNFVVPQSQQEKSHIVISIHNRSCYRSLDKISRMREDPGYHPEKAQSYLFKWSLWWSKVGNPEFNFIDCLSRWVQKVRGGKLDRYAWLGSGLLAI